MFLKLSKNKQTNQSGSALVIAIFVLVIMTLLGSALVRMQHSSSETLVYEVYGTRAYTAAQAGIQWQLSEVFPLNLDSVLCPTNNTELFFHDVNGLENCQSEVTCISDISHDGFQYYTVTSVGSCNITNVDVAVKTSRTIKVEARSIK